MEIVTDLRQELSAVLKASTKNMQYSAPDTHEKELHEKLLEMSRGKK